MLNYTLTTLVAAMVADMEVDKVANMEVGVVTNMEVDTILTRIRSVSEGPIRWESWSQGFD